MELDLNSRKIILIASIVSIAVLGAVFMSWLPNQIGRDLLSQTEQDISFVNERVRGVMVSLGGGTLVFLLVLSFLLIQTLREESAVLVRENLRQREYESDVSHKVRTPLTIIRGYGGILLEDDDLDENLRHKFLRIIVSESNRLNQEMDDLLNLTRLESGRIILNKRPVRIDDLMKESIEKVSKEAEERKVKIETKFPKEILEVDADEQKVVQAMGNLLINSIMRSMAGEKVLLDAKYTKEGVKFNVIDNGGTLSSEEISRLFDKFQWIEPERQKFVTGLELPLAKAIVEAHSGKMSVDSNVVDGSKFSLTLPMS
jgi:signal transduction histidine kinase